MKLSASIFYILCICSQVKGLTILDRLISTLNVKIQRGYDYLEGLIPGAPCFKPRQVKCSCEGTLLTEFHPNVSKRGINPPDTKIFLFTLENPSNPEFLHDCCGQLPENTNFNPSHPTEVFVHGWLDGACRTAWMREMRDELFMRGGYNVILVDWTWGNLPDYAISASNNKIVGLQLGFVINNIMKQRGVSGSSFHIVGHSFGSHIAGFAGKSISGLRRITALDPASSPYKDADPENRLFKTDAQIVDVIHTSSAECFVKGIGYEAPIGHADFYPNGGAQQTISGREILSKFLKLDLAYGLFTISPYFYGHLIAIQFYKASINPCGCQFVGIKCGSYKDFNRGYCRTCKKNGSNCAVMGMDFELFYKDNGRNYTYYLNTDMSCPYCNNGAIDLNGFTVNRTETHRCANKKNLANKNMRTSIINL